MAITANDLELRYSAPAASAGSEVSQADPAASLGGYLSKTVWSGGVVHDLFGPVGGSQNAAQGVDYRCVFVVNKHTSLPWTGVVVWLSDVVDNGTEVAVGVDPTAASALTATARQARTAASVYAPPQDVVFGGPTTAGAGLAVGDIPSGHCKALWVRRAAFNSAAVSGDGATINLQGDTAA